jgi:hypothetical protein
MTSGLRCATGRLLGVVVHPLWLPVWAALGVLIRLGLVAKLGAAMTFYDEHDYDRIGQALADGRGFVNDGVVTAFRPPGQPFFLASVYALFGHHPVIAEALQAVLLGCIPFAVARIAGSLGLATAWGNAAGALASIHPGLGYASATLYPTALTAVTLTLGVMWSADAMAYGRRRQSVLAGAFLGFTGALTTTFVPLAALVAVIAAARRRWQVSLLIAAVGLLPAAVWMARNAVVVGAPVLATNGSYNLALGANDQATPRSGNWVDVTLPASYDDKGEVERDRAFRDLATQWIDDHKVPYALLVVERGIAVLDSAGRPKTRGEHDSVGARLATVALFPWVGLGVVGVLLERRKTTAWIAAAALACVVVTSAFTIAKPRFRFPCDPVLSAFVAASAVRGWTRWSTRKRPRVT